MTTATSPELVQRILEIHSRGRLTMNAIAKHLGIGRERVTRVLVTAGLHPPRPSRREQQFATEEQPVVIGREMTA